MYGRARTRSHRPKYIRMSECECVCIYNMRESLCLCGQEKSPNNTLILHLLIATDVKKLKI